MTSIPCRSPGRFLRSRSALKWSINSIQTPTPPWRSSTHVSASSAPPSSPKSPALPAQHSCPSVRLPSGIIPRGTVRSPHTVKQMKGINLAAGGVFSYDCVSDVNSAPGWYERSVWQMHTGPAAFIARLHHFSQATFTYKGMINTIWRLWILFKKNKNQF